MASPITSADFDNQSISGSLCDQFREKLLNNDKIATLLDYLFDENGLFNAAFLADFAKVVTPIGSIRMSAKNEAVSSGDGEAVWLPCDGQTLYTRTTYPTLAALLGETWNAASDTQPQKDVSFRTPDLRGRMPIGVGTGDAADATARTLAQKSGLEKHTLTSAELPAHSHLLLANAAADVNVDTDPTPSNYAASRTSNAAADYAYRVLGLATQPTIGLSSSVGSGTSHNNMPPTLAVHFYILAGYRSGGVIA